MFRDPLSILNRDAKAMVAPKFGARADVAISPRGLARFDDGILEIAGDGLRVAARDVVAIDLVPALGARMQLSVAYRKGFDTLRRRYWVSVEEADDLQRLVARVRGAQTAHATVRAA